MCEEKYSHNVNYTVVAISWDIVYGSCAHYTVTVCSIIETSVVTV